jgi:hypothetical protein
MFTVSGTITAIGQSQLNNEVSVYADIEITETTGRRVTVQKVAVRNEADASLQLGLAGQFFFNRVFLHGQPYRCQLWGIQADGLTVFDRKNLRVRVPDGDEVIPRRGAGNVHSGSATRFCSMPFAAMLAASASTAAALCGAFRAFLGDSLSLFSGTKTSPLFAILAFGFFMISALLQSIPEACFGMPSGGA